MGTFCAAVFFGEVRIGQGDQLRDELRWRQATDDRGACGMLSRVGPRWQSRAGRLPAFGALP